MGQDSHNLIISALVDESVKEDNAFIVEEAIHESIGMTTPLRPIHLVQLLQGELQGGRKVLNLGLQHTLHQLWGLRGC